MPLLDFIKNSHETIQQLSIQQILATAGDGKLKDGSLCSEELRSYLREASVEKFKEYINGCLNESFDKSGCVLQDIVNELGKRLDYQVENGLYQGVRNKIGFDGIWETEQGRAIVVEVKTSDAYRMSLDTQASYRDALIKEGRIPKDSSILFVVGREDTGGLESQIRGSRYAWDMRLISVDHLLQLVILKRDAEEEETLRKIRSLLTPLEYTRLDNLVDILFTTAQDIEATTTPLENPLHEELNTPEPIEINKQDKTPLEEIARLKALIISSFGKKLSNQLFEKSKAMFWSQDKNIRACCIVSKNYKRYGEGSYWYAFHPRYQTFLQSAKDAYCIFGCVDLEMAYAVPLTVIEDNLSNFYTTTLESGRMYWHLELVYENNQMFLLLRKENQKIPVEVYKFHI